MTLATLIRRSCDELEADLQDLGIWLGDLWTGRLSVRRAAVLASQLKPGSRVWQVGTSDAMWTTEDYWLAEIADRVANNNWLVANRGVDEGKQSDLPERIKRPVDLRADEAHAAKMSRNARLFKAAMDRQKARRSDGD